MHVSRHLTPLLIAISLVTTTLSACDTSRTGSRSGNNKLINLEADGVLIKFKPEFVGDSTTAQNARTQLLKSLDLKDAGIVSAITPNWVRAVPAKQSFSYDTIVNSLRRDASVEAAEPNYLVEVQATLPDDAEFNLQWGLNNTNVETSIDATNAWDIRADGKTVVAVIDTGVDYSHPDLRKNIWTNKDEIPNNGIDDDSNGLVDDVYGWNFVDNTANTADDNNHGTHAAGIIGAKGNNALGIAGVNWSARIMPLKVMNKNGQGSIANVIKAVNYAIEEGAKISNMSFGIPFESQALFEALQATYAFGHVIVAAAGNQGDNNDDVSFFPASYNLRNVISVAATDQSGDIASFSNFGARSVDIAAPGAGILSTTINSNGSQTAPNGFSVMSGTSCAAPFVTGVLSIAMDINPKLAPVDYRNLIVNNTTASPKLAGKVVSGGLLNASRVLSASLTAVATETVNASAAFAVTPSNAEIPVGIDLPLTVTGGVPPYTWTIDKPTIGTVDATTNNFKATQLGQVSVTAVDSSGASSSPAIINVVNMTLSPNTVTAMSIWEKQVFSVLGGKAPYNWQIISTSSSATVVKDAVDSSKATITASAGGTFRISVTDSTPTSALNVQSKDIVVNIVPLKVAVPTTTTVNVGDALTLAAAGGDGKYQWSSSDTTVATIGATTGTVTALRKGTVTITVRDGTNAVDTLALTVNAVPFSINVPTTSTLWVGNGSSLQLTTTGGLAPITWSSDNTAIATINTSGVVTAKAEGVATIRATDQAGTTATIAITVKKTAIIASSTSYTVGDVVQLNTVAYGNVVWSIVGTGANISTSGLLTANATGNVTITMVDQNNNSASLALTIYPQVSLASLTTTITVGEKLQFSATGAGTLQFSVSNTSVATISSSGLLSALSAGTVDVTVTDGNGKTAKSTITITPSLTLSTPSTTTLWLALSPNPATNQLQLNASNGKPSYTWSTSNASVAQVSSSGVVTAISSGSATISVRDQLNVTRSITITVSTVSIISATAGNMNNTIVDFVGDGAGQLNWTVVPGTGNGTIVTTGAKTARFTATFTGTVYVTMSDANNNVAVNAINITVR